MIKRILITLVLVLGVQMMPAPLAMAADDVPVGEIDSGSFMFDLSSVTHTGIEGSTRQGWIRSGVNYFFERIIGFMAAIIGSLSILMLSVGGFLMLSAGGDEQRYTKGKDLGKYALIGLAVTLSAYIMVTLVQLLINSIYG